MPKISALTSLAQADVVTTTDVLPIVDATAPATTKKVTVQAMVNAGLATLTTLPSGIVNASLTSVGTLTALTVSGTSTLGITRVSGADNSLQFGVSGATRGVRFNTSSFGSSIEGVDNTLVASYQPLSIVASVLGLYTTGGNAIALGTSSSTPQMYVTSTASAVNFIQATGAATGAAPSLAVGGSDANVWFNYYTKGSGVHQFLTGGGVQFSVGHVASSVNYWNITGAATGGLNTLTTQGSDTNIGAYLATKGSGSWRFATGGGDQVRITDTASAVNRLELTGSATGNAVTISTGGSDTNISFSHATKGTGVHSFLTNGSVEQFRVAHVASAVNYLQAQGAATGASPILFATGSDPNVNLIYSLKGAGAHAFYTNSTTAPQFFVAHTASAANYVQATGAATGNAVSISASGSDSNIDFAIAPKGTGVLRFGTHSALAAETVTGYITIKDSAGNTRKLAVVS